MGRLLRRAVSSVLRGKKTEEPSMSGALSSIPEASPFEADEHELAADEHALQHAFVESLRDRSRTLEQERDAQQLARLRAEENLRVKTAELERAMARQLHERGRLQQLEGMVKNMEQEKKTLEQGLEKRMARLSELEAGLKDYRVWSVKSAEENRAQQQAIAVLEAEKVELARLVQNSDAVLDLQREKSQLWGKVQELQSELAREKTEGEVRSQELERIEARYDHLKKWIDELREEMETTKSDASRELASAVAQLEEERNKHKVELKKAEGSRVLDGILTPRVVLVNALLRQSREVVSPASEDVRRAAAPFLQSCSPAMLTNQYLDVKLSRQQARRLMENVAVGELTLLVCDMCRLPKLAPRAGIAQPRIRVNEFAGPSRRTACCSRSICRECYLEALIRGLGTDWWMNPGVSNWLLCPVSTCQAQLSISYKAGLETLLRQLGDKEIGNHLEMWDRAEAFRAALARHTPAPSNDALLIASALQNHLVALGCMYSLFDPRFANKAPDETGRLPPFNPGKIRTVSIDDERSNSINVPVFGQFFRRRQTPQQCSICTDDFFELDISSAKEWLELCEGFQGSWMWDVLLFPLKLGLECRHSIDFCTGCLQTHLKSQLEQHGRGACDQLLCPSVECGRKLSYQEMQLYGDKETFAQYDKYLHLDALSRLPNFRWCLRQGCSNGQLYDDDDGPLDPHTYCEECSFEMCFVHSMPWHEGQTCEQYDSIRAHGDPEFQQTRDWIRENTKPCPGCGENIQKGEYCFHMTCTNCRFEYCWECLADWKLIAGENGTHNPEAHNEGCPFRTNGLRPTEVSGTNMEEAMGRRRRRR